ncbi:MAG: DUF4116 domain-containing protein, partial [Verrucomicrobiota bacterium]|nr:DUF4116 domain-containing protein [Verrucomicrobiota bacterium]
MKSALNGHRFHLKTFDFLALPTRPTLPPFSARPAWSNSSAGLQQQQDGKALQWASEGMKGDRELCMAAVAQSWCALKLVAKRLQKDETVLQAAKGSFLQDG